MQEAKESPGKAIAGNLLGAGKGGLYDLLYHGSLGLFLGSCIGAFIGVLLTLLIFMINKEL